MKALFLTLITVAIFGSLIINSYQAEMPKKEPVIVQCVDRSYQIGNIEIIVHCEEK